MIDRMIDDEKFISQIQPRPERHEIAILKRLRRFHLKQKRTTMAFSITIVQH